MACRVCSPFLLALAAFLVAATIVRPASAVTKTWTGGNGVKLWSDDANWSPAGVPASTDDVIISIPGGLEVQVSSANATCKSLTLSNGIRVAQSRQLILSGGGGTLDGGYILLGSDLVGGGALVFTGGSQTLGGNGEVQIIQSHGGGGLGISGTAAMMVTIGAGITIRTEPGENNGGNTIYFSMAAATQSFKNLGTIILDQPGKTTDVQSPGNFINAGFIQVTAGATFQIDVDTTAVGAGAVAVSDDGIFRFFKNNSSGVQQITNNAGHVYVSSLLDNTGGTVQMQGHWGVSGTLLGGTVVVLPGGLLDLFNGTFDGITLQGPARSKSGFPHIKNGLTLNAGTISVYGTSSNGDGAIQFDAPSQTLGGTGEILLIPTAANAYFTAIGASSTLTIAPGVTIHSAEAGTGFGAVQTSVASATIKCQGTVRSDVAGRTIKLLGSGQIQNLGLMEASSGTLRLEGNYLNPGSGVLSSQPGGIIELAGTYALPSPGLITNAGSVSVLGTITGGGQSLNLPGTWSVGGSAALTSLTLTGVPGTSLSFSGTPTLTGVTLAAPAAVAGGAAVKVVNGLTLSGSTLTVDSVTGVASVDFSGTQLLGGTGTVVLQQESAAATSRIQTAGSGTVLTIGPGVSVRDTAAGAVGTASIVTNAGHSIVSQGAIISDQAGRTVTLSGAGGFTNSGLLDATNGGAILLGGSYTTAGLGIMDVAAGTLRLGGTINNAAATLALQGVTKLEGPGTISNGSVTVPAGVELQVTGAAATPAVLDGVSLTGDARVLNTGSNLRILHGLTLNGGTLTVASGATASAVDFNGGAQTLGGTGSIVLSSGGGTATLSASAGTNPLTIAPGITIKTSSTAPTQTPQVNVAGSANSIVNQGVVSSESAAHTLKIIGSAFTNAGTLQAINGATLDITATVTNYASNTLTGGQWKVDPSSAITWSAATIRTLGAGSSVTLNGAGSSFAALNGLTTVTPSASLSLLAGRDLAPAPLSGTLTNNGAITLGANSNLTPVGGFSQGATGSISKTLASATDPAVTATTAVSLGGGLSVAFAAPFTLVPPASAPLVSGSSLSGAFATATTPLDGSPLLLPPLVYSSTSATLTASYLPGAFIGGSGSSWFNPSNWGSGALPGAGTSVLLPVLAVIGDGAALAHNVTVLGGGGLRLQARGSLQADTVVVKSGASLELTDSTALLAVKNLTLEPGAQLSWTAGSIEIDGGTFTSPAALMIGCIGSASLHLVNGATVVAPGVETCPAGTVQGTGVIASPMTNGGSVLAGDPMGSLACQQGYWQSESALLSIQLGSAGHGSLLVGGEASLAGSLELLMTPGDEPGIGRSLPILSATSVVGSPTRLNSPSSADRVAWPEVTPTGAIAHISGLPSAGSQPVSVVARVLAGATLDARAAGALANELAAGRSTPQWAASQIAVVSPAGDVGLVGPALSGAPAVAWDATGRFGGGPAAIVVAREAPAPGACEVDLISADGSMTVLVPESDVVGVPRDIAVDSSGRLVIAGDTGVSSLLPGGAPTLLIPMVGAHRVAIGSNDMIAVSATDGSLGLWSSTGTPIHAPLATGLASDAVLAIPAAGSVWGSRIYVVSGGALLGVSDDGTVAQVGRGFDGAVDMVFDSSDSLLVLFRDVADVLRVAGPSADLNGDGHIDGADLGVLLGHWGPCPDCPGLPCDGDVNGDCVVDGADLGALLGQWG